MAGRGPAAMSRMRASERDHAGLVGQQRVDVEARRSRGYRPPGRRGGSARRRSPLRRPAGDRGSRRAVWRCGCGRSCRAPGARSAAAGPPRGRPAPPPPRRRRRTGSRDRRWGPRRCRRSARCAPGLSAIACTMKPSSFAAGAAAATRASIASAAASTASGAKPSATPPTSDLWVISGERIFSATAHAAQPARDLRGRRRRLRRLGGQHRHAVGGQQRLCVGVG